MATSVFVELGLQLKRELYSTVSMNTVEYKVSTAKLGLPLLRISVMPVFPLSMKLSLYVRGITAYAYVKS